MNWTLLLWLRDDCANVAKTDNEESYGLEEEVDVKMVPPIRKIIPSAGEEEGSHTKLRNVQPEFCYWTLVARLKKEHGGK